MSGLDGSLGYSGHGKTRAAAIYATCGGPFQRVPLMVGLILLSLSICYGYVTWFDFQAHRVVTTFSVQAQWSACRILSLRMLESLRGLQGGTQV